MITTKYSTSPENLSSFGNVCVFFGTFPMEMPYEGYMYMYTGEHTISIKLVFWCQNPDCKGKSTLTIKIGRKNY